jgi:subtilisin family serine protease
MKKIFQPFLIVFSAFMITACGGGGGGSTSSSSSSVDGTSPTTSQYSLAQPTLLSASPAIGIPTVQPKILDFGTGSLVFPERKEKDNWDGSYYNYASTTVGSLIFEPTARISLPSVAWASGWGGKGVTVSVVDDFTSKPIAYSINFDKIPRKLNFFNRSDTPTNGEVNLLANVNYSWVIDGTILGGLKMSHGDLVASIAGGNGQGNVVSENLLLEYKNSDITSCIIVSQSVRNDLSCSLFTNRLYGVSIIPYERVVANYKKTPGIAKDALVVKNNITLTSAQNPIKTVSDIQGHLLNSQKTNVINLSLGSEIPTTGQSFASIMAEVTKFPIPKLEAVIVVAAGNGGAPCATQDLSGCNSIAVAMAYQQSTRESTIVAGALQGEGLNENIATYSTRAGILADRFLLASGDAGYTSITTPKFAGETGIVNVKGTSFAAPIISGAAALIKQKYPSLSSKQVADILLLSANKDINNDGVPDFAGVSAIYGQGKLDINRALSLAGAIK